MMERIIEFENRRGENYLEYLSNKLGGQIVNENELIIDHDKARGKVLVVEKSNFRLVITQYQPYEDTYVKFSTDEKYEYNAVFFSQNIIYQKNEKESLQFSTPRGFILMKKSEKFTVLNKANEFKKIIVIYFNKDSFPEQHQHKLESIDNFAYHVGDRHIGIWKKNFEVKIVDVIHEDLQRQYLKLKLEELFLLFQNILFTLENNDKKTLYSDYEIESIYAIKKVIDANLSLKPNLKKLTIDYGISAVKLNKIYKFLFGQTVYNYYKEQRIHKAKDEVVQSQKNLTEIAYDYGFTDINHFSKSFIEAFGITPSELKKSLKK
ncbi:helix-turn-helix domain-containing protein [Flammeovirga agarivorans]|uniref:Helix-turn-helix transcriptional regulator n=1 Tax=Flammeovirga agarivorans TaxID=2726742 RepID=A0A7X8XV52_9BACT|nr:helix-turn-helix domain-containing protein [Flammeovirga agarivorans]NLR90978.1 helix-turn-helix transcriptional regulator [Flammeovirga agarivorans]